MFRKICMSKQKNRDLWGRGAPATLPGSANARVLDVDPSMLTIEFISGKVISTRNERIKTNHQSIIK